MSKEIERKFLVTDNSFRDLATSRHHIRQTYLSWQPESTVRLRTVDDKGFVTIKSKNHGATRNEWEYEVPALDIKEIIGACRVSPVIDKTRYRVGRWEIDEFHGALEGLTVAEIELTDENEQFGRPPFIGREVTGDARYYNSSLAFASEPPC